MAKRFKIMFEVDVPDDMPADAAKEWLAYECHAISAMMVRHPQMDCGMSLVPGKFVCLAPGERY